MWPLVLPAIQPRWSCVVSWPAQIDTRLASAGSKRSQPYPRNGVVVTRRYRWPHLSAPRSTFCPNVFCFFWSKQSQTSISKIPRCRLDFPSCGSHADMRLYTCPIWSDSTFRTCDFLKKASWLLIVANGPKSDRVVQQIQQHLSAAVLAALAVGYWWGRYHATTIASFQAAFGGVDDQR